MNFDWEMHYLRSFAIVAVMATHFVAMMFKRALGEHSRIFMGT